MIEHITSFLSFCAAISTSALSVAGSFAVLPIWGVAVLMLVFSGPFEYKVFQKNIGKALKNLFIEGPRKQIEAHIREKTNNHAPLSQDYQTEIRRKLFFTVLAGIACFGAGIWVGLGATVTLPLLFTTLGVGFLATGYFILPLAIFTGIGTFLTFYNTLARKIIAKDGFSKWVIRVREGWNGTKSNLKRFGMIVGGFLMMGLAAFVTVSSAETALEFAKKGLSHLFLAPESSGWLTPLVTAMTAFLMMTTAVYTFVNSLKTVELCVNNEYEKEEENPCWWKKIYNRVIKPVGFVVHVVSMGVMGDRIENLPSWITAVINTVNEALVDFGQLVGIKRKDKEKRAVLVVESPKKTSEVLPSQSVPVNCVNRNPSVVHFSLPSSGSSSVVDSSLAVSLPASGTLFSPPPRQGQPSSVTSSPSLVDYDAKNASNPPYHSFSPILSGGQPSPRGS